MAGNMPLLRPLAIAAGGLGCVSINSTVIFIYFKHLEISTVQVANSVNYILFLFYRNSVNFTFPNLTFAPDSLHATQQYMYICYYTLSRCFSSTILLHTPWSRVLLEKLTRLCRQSRNSPHFYGTRKFFTVLTSSPHSSLS
jgi:hypothetical protein